jgi:hypothetical protein
MRPELGAARRQFAVVPQSGDKKVGERGPVSQVLGDRAWPGRFRVSARAERVFRIQHTHEQSKSGAIAGKETLGHTEKGDMNGLISGRMRYLSEE